MKRDDLINAIEGIIVMCRDWSRWSNNELFVLYMHLSKGCDEA